VPVESARKKTLEVSKSMVAINSNEKINDARHILKSREHEVKGSFYDSVQERY
jgi:hypothetical protein